MKNQACAQVVVNALGRQEGVQPGKVDVDFARRVVTVQYDSLMTARKNLEFAVAEAGFQANEVPANALAAGALPVECK